MAKIIIAKHRNGAIGDITLRFRAQYAKFQNVDDTEEPMDALPYTQPANNSSSDGIRIQGRLDDSARISDDEPAPF
jgi:replicative DNA helicase